PAKTSWSNDPRTSFLPANRTQFGESGWVNRKLVMYGTPGLLGRGGKSAGNTGGANVPARRLTLPYSPYHCSARMSRRPIGSPPNFSRSKTRSYSERPVYLKTFPRPNGAGTG